MKTHQLGELGAVIGEAVRAEVAEAMRDGLNRVAVDVLLESATADASLREAMGPLVLADHERRVLAALLDGDADLADVEGLLPEHFYSRQRGLAFGVLHAAACKGQVLGRNGLRAALVASSRGPAAIADVLLDELDREPVVLGQPLRACVLELLAASAWRDFVAGVRRLNALARAHALGFDDRRDPSALEPRRLRQDLRALAEALTPALRACEEVDS
jgi:hypothetical protein